LKKGFGNGWLYEFRRTGSRGLLPRTPKGVPPACIGPPQETSHPHRLRCFEEVRKKLRTLDGVHHGLRVVRVEQIAGSVGGCSEFGPDFLPLGESAKPKWDRIDRAFHRGEEHPLVRLYKVGSSYFA
jgi:hypothetical protein